jgi:fatty acid-binding protein DegV
MGVGKKYRGKFELTLNEYVADRLANIDDLDLSRVFVTHAGVDMDTVTSVAVAVKAAAPFKEVLITRAGCTISAHCGRNTLGVLFIRKSEVTK